MKTIKKILLVALVTLSITSCSEGIEYERELTCKEVVDKKYMETIKEELDELGYEFTFEQLNVNTTDPLSPGFLQIDHHPNMKIYMRVVGKYPQQWSDELKLCK